MMIKVCRVLICLVLVLIVCLGAGCGNKQEQEASSNSNKHVLVDYKGNKVTLKEKPQRIASMSISTDEIIINLVAPERIAAVSYLADDPGISSVTELVKAVKGRVTTTSGEAMVGMGVDLVIVPDWYKPEQIKTYQDLQLPIYVYKTPSTIAEVEDCIMELGKAVGEEQKAAKLVKGMEQRLKALRNKLGNIPEEKRKRVISGSSYGFYYSEKTSFRDFARLAQAKDATLELKAMKPGLLSQETIIKLDPDAVILSDWDGKDKKATDARDEFYKNPAYSSMKAVKNKDIHMLQGKYLLGLSSYSVGAIEEMARALYPECFK